MTKDTFERRCKELRRKMGVFLRTVDVPKSVRLKNKPAECPRCLDDNNTLRKGVTLRGKQRHRCLRCRHYFIGDKVKSPPKGSTQSGLMCYWCGGSNAVNQGGIESGGKCGYCRDCKKYFTQGGKFDLERYHLLLSDRINKLGVPRDVARELFQIASLDVLLGVGYCWTVPLNTRAAWKTARGDLREAGSGNAYYKQVTGDESENYPGQR